MNKEQAQRLGAEAARLHEGETSTWMCVDGKLTRTAGNDPSVGGIQILVTNAEAYTHTATDEEVLDPEYMEKLDAMHDASRTEYAGVKNPYLVKQKLVVVANIVEGEPQESFVLTYEDGPDGPVEKTCEPSEIRS